MSLTTETIESATPGITTDGRRTDKPYRMWDSGGLYLEVSPAGGKWWRLKYRFKGREKRLSLGVCPNVSLKEARTRRDSFRGLLADGIDPSEHAKTEMAMRRAEEAKQLATTRFSLDNNGALSFRLGNRRLTLSPTETAELRVFLDATRAVTPKVTPCP